MKEVRKQSRKELIGAGMKSGFIHTYTPRIRKCLQDVCQASSFGRDWFDEPIKESTFHTVARVSFGSQFNQMHRDVSPRLQMSLSIMQLPPPTT